MISQGPAQDTQRALVAGDVASGQEWNRFGLRISSALISGIAALEGNEKVKVHLLICAALFAAMPATAWADDPNDPAMRRADAMARDREMTRQLNLQELARVRQRDARSTKVAREARVSGSYAADEEYAARSRAYDSAMANYADDRAKYEREKDEWRQAVAACRAGDFAACD